MTVFVKEYLPFPHDYHLCEVRVASDAIPGMLVGDEVRVDLMVSRETKRRPSPESLVGKTISFESASGFVYLASDPIEVTP